MPTEIIVKYRPAEDLAHRIRALLCAESRRPPEDDYNPLQATEFNVILDTIAQEAFNDGRLFERKHGALKP